MPRPTGRGYALLALAVVTYLAARLVGTWELFLLAFAFLAVVLLSWLLVALTGRRISVNRTFAPDRPVAGDEPEIISTIKNASFLPGPQLTLRSRLEGLSAADLEAEVESLAPRGETVIKARIERVKRGVHHLPPAEAVAEDPLGVARATHRAGDPLDVTVLPSVVQLQSCVLYPDIGLRHDWAGTQGLSTFGASEFRGIRPHQPGEPLSHIDWKSTAKTGILMLREMEEPAGADITLLLDGTSAQVIGDPPENNFELAVKVAGSLGDFLLRAGRGLTLLCHERTWRHERLTADAGGRRALLQALAETEPTAPAPLAAGLQRLRAGDSRLLRRQSITLVSISLSLQLVRALLELRDEGARPVFVYVDGASFTRAESPSLLLPFLPPKRPESAAPAGAATLSPAVPAESPGGGPGSGLSTEARALLLSLSSAGIPCLTLDRGDDLAGRLSLWRPGRRGRAAAL
jgi:uncharacterized protein (DUF58 family)